MDYLRSFLGKPPSLSFVVSEQPYEVLADDNAKARAEFLYRLEKWACKFLDDALGRWGGDRRLRRVNARWNRRLNEVLDGDDAAFSKGKKAIFVCVWDKRSQRLESDANARYILLHELAHVANETYGHDEAFWANFAALLEMAETLGAYSHTDHEPEKTYCGHRIGRSPAACRFDGVSKCETFI